MRQTRQVQVIQPSLVRWLKLVLLILLPNLIGHRILIILLPQLILKFSPLNELLLMR